MRRDRYHRAIVRQARARRIDDWFLRFHKDAPALFWMFSAALGCVFGALLMKLLELLPPAVHP